jgi:hypothetical protein
MSYEEDGKKLENLSQFESSSFQSFPNTYEDNKHVRDFTDLTDEQLDNKVSQYGDFLQGEGLMPRARFVGNRVLKHLIQEHTYRIGGFDYLFQREDESCNGI